MPEDGDRSLELRGVEYIADTLPELRQIALNSHADMLAYLLEVALVEAKYQAADRRAIGTGSRPGIH